MLSLTVRTSPRPFFFYERLSDLMVVANSSVNFIVYCFCSRMFRQTVMSLVCRGKGEDSGGGARNGRPSVGGGGGNSVVLSTRRDPRKRDSNPPPVPSDYIALPQTAQGTMV